MAKSSSSLWLLALAAFTITAMSGRADAFARRATLELKMWRSDIN
jgi:hypothetical protein